MRVLITGGAGNLGRHLTRHLLNSPHQLRLLVHRRPLPAELGSSRAEVCHGDLAAPESLAPACDDVDCIVHLAGVLFAPHPAKFLPKTNVEYVENLLHAAQRAGVSKFILVSFPHVEGETTPERPATERLDAAPDVIHFRTRLQAERAVLGKCEAGGIVPIIVRAGLVYGREVKLIEAARWLLRRRLMAVWRRPTWIHLIALPDFLAALQTAIESPQTRGIYNVGDDSPMLLQDFLDQLARWWGYHRPWRMPEWVFHAAGGGCELFASIFRTAAPLTRDIVRAGMTSSVADNRRMKQELLPSLAYPSLEQGLELLR